MHHRFLAEFDLEIALLGFAPIKEMNRSNMMLR
jgi:hypothetical protein